MIVFFCLGSRLISEEEENSLENKRGGREYEQHKYKNKISFTLT